MMKLEPLDILMTIAMVYMVAVVIGAYLQGVSAVITASIVFLGVSMAIFIYEIIRGVRNV